MNLQQKIFEFINVLFEKWILPKNTSSQFEDNLVTILINVKKELKNAFPHTKEKFKMRSVHYANSFQNEDLRNIAFLLDDIEEILCQNKISHHDNNVKYFNKRIIEKDFVITPENLLIVSIESIGL